MFMITERATYLVSFHSLPFQVNDPMNVFFWRKKRSRDKKHKTKSSRCKAQDETRRNVQTTSSRRNPGAGTRGSRHTSCAAERGSCFHHFTNSWLYLKENFNSAFWLQQHLRRFVFKRLSLIVLYLLINMYFLISLFTPYVKKSK